jgi:hypothetical protein
MDRNHALFYKILTVGIIAIFIGVGVKPAFAVDASVNPNSLSEEIYKNYDCIVIGKANHTQRGRDPFNILLRVIGFGLIIHNTEIRIPSVGWIYTKGSRGEWFYKGKFWGQLGPIAGFPAEIASYIGIDSFHGMCFRGITALSPFHTRFIGWARAVEIANKYP